MQQSAESQVQSRRRPSIRVIPSLAGRPPRGANLPVSSFIRDRLKKVARRRKVYIRQLVEDALLKLLEELEDD